MSSPVTLDTLYVAILELKEQVAGLTAQLEAKRKSAGKTGASALSKPAIELDKDPKSGRAKFIRDYTEDPTILDAFYDTDSVVAIIQDHQNAKSSVPTPLSAIMELKDDKIRNSHFAKLVWAVIHEISSLKVDSESADIDTLKAINAAKTFMDHWKKAYKEEVAARKAAAS
jgi:hypothetical protein